MGLVLVMVLVWVARAWEWVGPGSALEAAWRSGVGWMWGEG